MLTFPTLDELERHTFATPNDDDDHACTRKIDAIALERRTADALERIATSLEKLALCIRPG